MKYQYELTDELDEQTPPEFQAFSFAQEVTRVAAKLKISKAEIARRMEIAPQQLNRLMTGKSGKTAIISSVQKFYFLALRAIEFETIINKARAREEKQYFDNLK